MIRQLVRRAAIIAMPLIAVPVLVLAAAPGMALASAPSATLQFHGQLQLQSDGSVLVTLDYSCTPETSYYPEEIGVVVQQSVVNAGGGPIFPVCDHQKHIVTIDVPPAPLSYTPGTAIVTASLYSGVINYPIIQAELKVR
jgi:hypothetical protein